MIPLAIIGGGASGTIAALHLRRLLPELPPITVIEPRATLGAGLAYGAGRPEHRINVPASRMTAISAEPNDFADWLQTHGQEAHPPGGDQYPSRAVFGRYVASRIAPYLKNGTVRHLRDTVARVEGTGPFRIETAGGTVIEAAHVLIATSHPPPALPAGIAPGPSVIVNPWDDAALAGIGVQERVAIVGTGLSMADVVATLDMQGHRGPILAFSRRGLRSRGHASPFSAPVGSYGAPSATALLRQVRHAIEREADWRAVIDAVRKQGDAIWNQLDPAGQRRVVRHLRPFWDVHRFRIAPPVEATLEARIADGSLELLAARLEGVAPDGVLDLRLRTGERRRWACDRIVNTTGPDHRGLLHRPGFLRDLARSGRIVPDPTGLGLHTDRDYCAVGQEFLFITGPLARGTFGELMGLPEITLHAEASAQSIARALTPESVFP